ncbi:MAG: hypothetical protein ACI4JJ_08225 [Huintestinicola sp.]
MFGKEKIKIRLDPFIIELAAVILVFSVSCAAVLKMFAVSSQRAEREQLAAHSIAAVQSLCEVYGVKGNLYETLNTVYPQLGGDISENMTVCTVILDGEGVPSEKSVGKIFITLTETEQTCTSEGIAYGVMNYAEVSAEIQLSGTERESIVITRAACYKPFSAVFAVEGSGDGS